MREKGGKERRKKGKKKGGKEGRKGRRKEWKIECESVNHLSYKCIIYKDILNKNNFRVRLYYIT